jgi:hypothetical protein
MRALTVDDKNLKPRYSMICRERSGTEQSSNADEFDLRWNAQELLLQSILLSPRVRNLTKPALSLLEKTVMGLDTSSLITAVAILRWNGPDALLPPIENLEQIESLLR